MIDNEISHYRAGYDECRRVIMGDIRKVLSERSSVRCRLSALLAELEEDTEADHWKDIQAEFPGITRQQYEAELDASAEAIRRRFYDKDGKLKQIRWIK